jgi:hypothetical protein
MGSDSTKYGPLQQGCGLHMVSVWEVVPWGGLPKPLVVPVPPGGCLR